MRKRLRVEARNHRVGDGLGLEHPVDTGDAAVDDAGGHRGAHRLGCEHRDLHALVAVA